MKVCVMAGAAAVLSASVTAAWVQAAQMPATAAPVTSKSGGKAPTVTGIDKIHDQVRVGSKVCMADHDHKGAGEMPSRKGAEGAAVRAWQVFTKDEYGSAWGNYQLAVAKTMQCDASGGRWTCNLSARPCRPAKV